MLLACNPTLLLFYLTILIKQALNSSCPTYQKFNQTSQECLINSPGTGYEIQCDSIASVKKFTIVSWVRYPTDPGYYSTSGEDTIFAISSVSESNPRLVLKYKFVTGLRASLGAKSGGTDSVVNKDFAVDNQASIIRFRSRWQLVVLSVDYNIGTEEFRYKVGFVEPGTTSGFVTSAELKRRDSGVDTVQHSDPLPSDLKLYFYGYPSNPSFGGCSSLSNVWLFLNYIPSEMSSSDESKEIALLRELMFEFSAPKPNLAMSYTARVKKTSLLNFIKECNVPSQVESSFSSTDNTYARNGIQLGLGTFFECVNPNLYITEDISLSFFINFSKKPNSNFPLINWVLRSAQNPAPSGATNSALPLFFNLVKLGVSLNQEGKLILNILGQKTEFSPTLEINKGYHISINLLKEENESLAGPHFYNRFITLFINGDYVQSFTFIYNPGVARDATLAAKNHHFFIGDFKNRATKFFSHIFTYPNPFYKNLNIEAEERSFSNLFISVNDIIIAESAQSSSSSWTIPSNCKLGPAGLNLCLFCKEGYVLDMKQQCKLKSSLPSITTFLNQHEAIIECGEGQFYNEGLGMCQTCPPGCNICSSLTTCSEYSSGCSVTNCARCSSNRATCYACSNGFVLGGSNNCLTCTKSNCDKCPVSDLNTCTSCASGYFFQQASNSCRPCSGCLECILEEDKCTKCDSTKYLLNSQCVPLIDTIFKWKGTEIIRSCFPTCTKCTDSLYNQCTACKSDFIPVFSKEIVTQNQLAHSCEATCPETHYIATEYQSVAGKYCLPCQNLIENCQKCTQVAAPAKPVCQSCLKGYFVQADPLNLYLNTCEECDSNCATCIGSAKNCLTCEAGKVLRHDGNKFVCEDYNPVSQETNLICDHTKFLYKGQCEDKCPVGTYRRPRSGGDCTECSVTTEGCYECDTNSAVCEKCSPQHKKRLDNTCYFCEENFDQCCEPGKGITAGTCTNCSQANCADCTIPEFCIKCNTGFINTELGECTSIITNCLTYNKQGTSCLVCNSNLLLDNGNCVSTCSTANTHPYVENGVLKCKPCDSKCSTCTEALNDQACITCKPGSVKVGTACRSCPNSDKCQTFTANTCTCTSCKLAGQHNINGVCYDTCPEGYFLNGASCAACYGCKECTATTAAGCKAPLKCMDGFVELKDTEGVISTQTGCCADGKYFDGTSCQNCAANCKRCTQNGAANCLEGLVGYYPTGSALSTCPTNFKTCMNSNAVLGSKESCKFNERAYLDDTGPTWVGQCVAAAGGSCDYAEFDPTTAANRCLSCSNFLNRGSASVCQASCSSGLQIENEYKDKGRIYKGGLCPPELKNCASVDDFYKFGCKTCKNGFYLVKTNDRFKFDAEESRGDKELQICAECDSTCLTCNAATAYACTSCASPRVFYKNMCLNECPTGFTKNASQVCIQNNCNFQQFSLSGNCYYKCPKTHFPDFSTRTCKPCSGDCVTCWGDSGTSCRTCDLSAGKIAKGDGKCIICPEGQHIDKEINFVCAEAKLYTKIDKLPANAGSGDPGFAGVELLDGAEAPNGLSADAESYLGWINNDWKVKIGTISYEEERVCWQTLVQFDYKLSGYNEWHDKELKVLNSTNEIASFKHNKWDFEDHTGNFESSPGVSNTHEQIGARIFLKNTNCTAKNLDLTFKTSLQTNALTKIKNLRVYFYKCPLDCLSCLGSTTCDLCKESKFFYGGLNICKNPFESVKEEEKDLFETKVFLFKPESFFLVFNKGMNFTLDDPERYFFPSLVLRNEARLRRNRRRLLEQRDDSDLISEVKSPNKMNTKSNLKKSFYKNQSFQKNTPSLSKSHTKSKKAVLERLTTLRIIEETGKEIPDSDINLIFISNNIMEVNIKNYNEENPVTADFNLKYPLVDLDSQGYNFSSIKTKMYPNSGEKTFFDEYIQNIVPQKKYLKFGLTALPIIFIKSLGANWLFFETCQRLYLNLMINVQYSKDTEDFLSMMEFSFFSYIQKLTSAVFSGDEYWTMIKYEEYINRSSPTEQLNLKFIDFIPKGKLGKYLVRKSFLINLDLLCLVLFVALILLCVIRCCRFIVLKKCKSKEGMVSFFNFCNQFLFCKFFTRVALITYAPVLFYSVGEFTFLNFGASPAKFSSFAMIAVLAFFVLLWVLMCCSACLIPFPKDSKITKKSIRRRTNFSQPFCQYMKYLKNPNPFDKDKFMEDADEDLNAVNHDEKDLVHRNLLITDAKFKNVEGKSYVRKKKGADLPFVENEKMRIQKDDELFDEELVPVEDKKKKKEPKPAFINLKRLAEIEKEEIEARKAERENKQNDLKEEEKEDEKSGEGDSSSEEEKKNDEKAQQSKTELGKDDDEESSSESSESEESKEKLENVKDFGRLLGMAVVKAEKRGKCCQCKCLRRNPCIMRMNSLLERTAKFFPLIRCMQFAILGILSWYCQDKPKTHALVSACLQTFFLVWVLTARPYRFAWMNFAAILIEIGFVVMGWGAFLLASGSTILVKELMHLFIFCGASGVFLIAFVTFVLFAIASMILFCLRMSKSDDDLRDD